MLRFTSFQIVLLALGAFISGNFKSQTNYQYGLTTTKDICIKGSAGLEIFGTVPADTVAIKWSSGQTDIRQIYDLSLGNYSVYIKIKHKKDSIIVTNDTTLYFNIDKDLCGVSVDKYFSPNDDNYHDFLAVNNAQFHPNFELHIFNKWGQKVHFQKNTYEPWDGKWNGIALPDGAYYYVFFYDTEKKTQFIKGDITILR